MMPIRSAKCWPRVLGGRKRRSPPRSSFSGTQLEVTRETDSGEETLSLPLPAVVTADLRLAEPRYIALPGIIKARTKPLEKVQPAQHFRAQRLKVDQLEPAPARAAGRKVGSVDELVSALRSMGAIS